MDTIIDSFHVDIKLLIAQVINFTIVFSVLFYFVIKPLMKGMKDRTEKIESSLKEAEDIKKQLAKTEDDYNRQITIARKEAGEIIEQAVAKAEKKKNEMITKAKEEIGVVINKEKEGIRAEKEKVMIELKTEVVDLVTQSLEKVLEKKIDKKEDKDLIEKIIS